MATIGEERVILPSDAGLKLADLYGQCVGVLRLDDSYYIRKGRSDKKG